MQLSQKANLLTPSPTLKMAALANELKAQGNPVINLTVGEPDWFSFEAAKQGGHQAIDQNITKYTPASGLPQLKKKVAQLVTSEFNVSYTANEIAIGSGAKFLIYAAFQMLLDAQDEVIIPSPYWVSYPAMVDLSSGRSKILTTTAESNFKVTAEQLEQAITPQTKLLVLCSPNNPTGVCYTAHELKLLADVLLKYPQVLILSDDIYNRLLLSDEVVAPHLLHVCPELKPRLISINGGSKSFAMTGWRIGWIAGPSHLISKVGDYLSQTTSNASSISQMALLSVLDNFESELATARKTLQERQLLIEKLLNQAKIKFAPPQGAFYYFLDIRPYLNSTRPHSLAFAEQLLSQFFVATVAGSDFGAEGWLRISFASSNADLTEGLNRLIQYINQSPT